MTHVDLFSGIGGFALAAGWAGFRTVAFCEIDPFCQEVLKERFGAVADAGDPGLQGNEQRRPFGEGRSGSQASTPEFSESPILIPDIRSFDGARFRGATLLTGGFPCQPFSVAGKRKGKDDTRHLWPEMLRVISEARPAWVVGENVAGIVNMELEQVCLDLEGEGYEVQPVIIPAAAVNAPHRRDRVWIIANSIRGQRDGRAKEPGRGQDRGAASGRPDCDARNSLGPRTDARSAPSRSRDSVGESDRHAPDAGAVRKLQPQGLERQERGRDSDYGWGEAWAEIAARFCGMDDGLPVELDSALGLPCEPPPEYQKGAKAAGRAHRLKALGNAIVPQVAYEIIKGIAEIERRHHDSQTQDEAR